MEKIKKRVKKEKGITVAALTITVIVLLIVTATMIINVNARYQAQKLDRLSSDLQLLEDKVWLYYTEHGEYPRKLNSSGEENGQEYEIDLSKLSGLTLNYGSGIEGEEDVYTINIRNGLVSYKKGIEYKGKVYHSRIIDEEEDVKGFTIIKLEKQLAEIKNDKKETIRTIKITKPSQKISIKEGETLILTVQSNLKEEDGLTYQWYQDGEEIENATKESIEIIGLENEIEYYCMLTCNSSSEKSRESSKVVVSLTKAEVQS